MKKVVVFGLATLLFVSCKKEERKNAETPTISEELSGVAKVDSTSTIAWIGSKPTGKHNGEINVKDGEFTLEKGKITQGKFIIDMNSIAVLDLEGEDKTNLEAHLKGTNKPEAEDHFFNVKKFPEATFEVIGYANENGSELLEGNLTLKGKTNKVKFPVSVEEKEGFIHLTSTAFEINRTLWDVKYGSKSFFDDLGDKYINDEISLTLNIKAKKN